MHRVRKGGSMDTRYFDDLVRLAATSRSRRSVAGLWIGGMLGASEFERAGARKKRKKKPCGPCQLRKKGKCKGTQPDGSACPGGSCLAGSCATLPPPPSPPSPPAPPSPPPPPCQGKPDLTVCGEGKACSGGVCAEGPPNCYVGYCSGLPLSCCGGFDCAGDCLPVGPGGECNVSSDCTADLTCVGFVCQAP